MKKRFKSNKILGFLLGVIALSLGRHALASEAYKASYKQDQLVNLHIKEEYIRIDAAQKLNWQQRLPAISNRNNNQVGELPRQPVELNSPLIDHEDNISSLEQGGNIIEDPRQGFAHKDDPTDAIEEKIANEQAYSLYREHYRHAMKTEIIRRAQAAGYQPTDREANDVTARVLQGQ